MSHGVQHGGAPGGQLQAMLHRAGELHRAGRVAEAADTYRQLSALAPGSADVWHRLAAALLTLGQPVEAAAAAERAARLEPKVAEILVTLGTAQRSAGRLDAAIESYRRALRLRPAYVEVHYNLGNVYLQAGRWEDAAQAYRRALAARPAYAEARNNLGHALLALEDGDGALRCFEALAAMAPHQAEVHANVAAAQFLRGDFGQAEAAYRRAIGCRADDAALWGKLAGVQSRLGDGPGLIASCRQVVRLLPGNVDAQYALAESLATVAPEEALGLLRGVLSQQAGRVDAVVLLSATLCALGEFEAADRVVVDFPGDLAAEPRLLAARATPLQALLRLEEAEAALTAALSLSPEYPTATARLGVNHLLLGRYAAGFALYETRFAAGSPVRPMTTPRWDGGDLAGRTLLVHAEQGLGDSLQFCRFATQAAARGRVVLAVQPPLCGLLRSLNGPADIVADTADLPPHDVQLPMMSLPAALGVTLDDLPGATSYLRADAALVGRWRERLSAFGGLKVGVCWAGNPTNTLDRTRSIPLAMLAPVFEVPGVLFVSLQTQARPGEVATDYGLHDWTSELDDFAQTAALISALDLVITVDTSVAHLAGALGRPTWLLNRFNTEWRWMVGRSDSPWYPTVRVFRQPALSDWGAVIEAVVVALGGYWDFAA